MPSSPLDLGSRMCDLCYRSCGGVALGIARRDSLCKRYPQQALPVLGFANVAQGAVRVQFACLLPSAAVRARSRVLYGGGPSA